MSGGPMKVIRTAAVVAAVGGVALGLAGPASADLADGTYQMTYFVDPGPPETVLVTSCGDGCKHVQMVGPYTASEYHLEGNTWIAPDPKGPKTIDNDTLTGLSHTWAYQLTKVG